MERHNETHARAGTILAPASKVTTGRANSMDAAAPGMGCWPGIHRLSQGEGVGCPLLTGTPPSHSKPGPGGEQSGVEGPRWLRGVRPPKEKSSQPMSNTRRGWAWEEQHPGPKFRGQGGRWWEFSFGFPGICTLLLHSPNKEQK